MLTWCFLEVQCCLSFYLKLLTPRSDNVNSWHSPSTHSKGQADWKKGVVMCRRWSRRTDIDNIDQFGSVIEMRTMMELELVCGRAAMTDDSNWTKKEKKNKAIGCLVPFVVPQLQPVAWQLQPVALHHGILRSESQPCSWWPCQHGWARGVNTGLYITKTSRHAMSANDTMTCWHYAVCWQENWTFPFVACRCLFLSLFTLKHVCVFVCLFSGRT